MKQSNILLIECGNIVVLNERRKIQPECIVGIFVIIFINLLIFSI
jgi:hypothetical protein